MPIPIDEYSSAAKPLQMLFQGQALSTGTGFVWQARGKNYLITNWHNVSGRDANTGELLSRTTAAEPDSLKVWLDTFGGIVRLPIFIPLRDDSNQPTWLQHPSGPKVDVVAVPLGPNPFIQFHPINLMRSAPIRLQIGLDCFVLGFPFPIDNRALPIWKRASIASEPQVAISGRPHIYVDTASRPGMSGSPVILRSWLGYEDLGGDYVMGSGAATSFIGVYSGRIGANDNLQAQLGIVWHAEVIEQIIISEQRGTIS